MDRWYRERPFHHEDDKGKERWIYKDGKGRVRKEVEVFLTLGKKTDLLFLKKKVLSNIKKQVEHFSSSRRRLYASKNQEAVSRCPVCGKGVSISREKVKIYGARYHQCRNCSHVYVVNRPSKKSIGEFYLSDINYASQYADKSLIEFRIEQIAVPWMRWMCDTFKRIHGKRPKNILDVGSGAGHFVFACKRAGIKARGIELSEHSRRFAKDSLGIELDGCDFTKEAMRYKGVDVVTFWGLLEHTTNPKEIMQTTSRLLRENPQAMVIAKVPRWYSISSAIQTILTGSIIRHLDPMGHIMCFTDASCATLFTNSGFMPRAAWYYGMDIYELLMQLGLKLDNIDILTKSGDVVGKLQNFIDQACIPDGLTLAGVPYKKGEPTA
ncbi:MAG: methyltransferase domain-containing protein [Candidatus Omnitrophota bacterium]